MKLNQADEKKRIEFEIYCFRRKMFKLNKELKYYRVSDLEITYSEVQMVPVTLHWQIGKRFRNWLRKTKIKNDPTGS